jgi:hypothetical protein
MTAEKLIIAFWSGFMTGVASAVMMLCYAAYVG